MQNMQKFNIKYDYSLILIFSAQSETFVCGSEKIVKKALKDIKNPNLKIKGLDIYYCEAPIGTLAVDIGQSEFEIEKVQNLVDKLYANLLDKRTNSSNIADTKISLDALFRTDKSVVVRVLAKTVLEWYKAVTDLYMNGRFGLALKREERAALGEQFRVDVNGLIENTFTVLKKKNPPQNTEDNGNIIAHSAAEMSDFFAEYSCYLLRNKIFCIRCKLCDNYFLAKSRNTLYCVDCKQIQKKNSKKIYAEKCSGGIHKQRQLVKFRIENFMFKKKEWQSLSDNAKSQYKAFRDRFVAETERMLKEYDKTKSKELEREIEDYLFSADTERARLEADMWNAR